MYYTFMLSVGLILNHETLHEVICYKPNAMRSTIAMKAIGSVQNNQCLFRLISRHFLNYEEDCIEVRSRSLYTMMLGFKI